MINIESLILEIRQALDRDPGAEFVLVKMPTLLCMLDVLTAFQDDLERIELGG